MVTANVSARIAVRMVAGKEAEGTVSSQLEEQNWRYSWFSKNEKGITGAVVD